MNLSQFTAEIKQRLDKATPIVERATPVNAWYAHPQYDEGHIRGPFNRWFQCLGPKERKVDIIGRVCHASMEEDILFATEALNEYPKAIVTIETLLKVVERQERALNYIISRGYTGAEFIASETCSDVQNIITASVSGGGE